MEFSKSSKEEQGLTLPEVLIALVIGSVLFVIVGMLLYQMQVFTSKGNKEFELTSNMRFGKMMIEKELRCAKSVSPNFIINPERLDYRKYVQFGSTVCENKRIEKAGDIVRMTNLDTGKTTELLRDVKDLCFYYPSTETVRVLNFRIGLEKITDYKTNSYTSIVSSFSVYLRNLEK